MYKLENISFSYQELEPYIDTHTLGLHYKKHQKGYLDKLNELLIANNFNFDIPIEKVYRIIDTLDNKNDILFFLGGVINHNIYWESINPHQKEAPNSELLLAINNRFGNMENFWEEARKLCLNIKGSGYIYLVIDKFKRLDLWLLSNQDSPYIYEATPLFCIDLWEHAYYLNYENDKMKYFDTMKIIANFKYANKIYKENC